MKFRCPAGRFHRWVLERSVVGTTLTVFRCVKCGAQRVEDMAS